MNDLREPIINWVGMVLDTTFRSLIFALVLMKVFSAYGYCLAFVVAPDPPAAEIRPDHTYPYTPPLALRRLARRS